MSKKKVYGDVKSFTVKRSEWVRGAKGGESKLLNGDGNRCCLGFYAESCGLRKQDIKGYCDPMDVRGSGKKWNSLLLEGLPDEETLTNSKACCSLMKINDNINITDAAREKKLTEQFAKLGIKIKFID